MLPLIVAPATPLGHAAIAVVRLSGAGLGAALHRVCGRIPPDRRASLVSIRDDHGAFDQAVLTVFRGPGSYTGEDVAEVSCHGNPLIVERLVGAFVAAGARVASPGEFTRRALGNGRMDTVGAEAVLATIGSTSEAGLALARSEPQLRSRVASLRDRLIDVSAELEAILDYPGEDLLFSTDGQIESELLSVAGEARRLAMSWRAGEVALEGARVALIGKVNAGKSSLFNALLGTDRAIVAASPGTTRDVVESALVVPGGRLVLVDTAGEREGDDVGEIEHEGIARARIAGEEADLRVVCLPATGDGEAGPARGPALRVATQIDLGAPTFAFDFAVSVVSGEGVGALRAALLPAITGVSTDAERIVTSARQRDVLLGLARAAEAAAGALSTAGPAVAVTELAAALRHADGFAGRDTGEAVLDRLFARFCVGK